MTGTCAYEESRERKRVLVCVDRVSSAWEDMCIIIIIILAQSTRKQRAIMKFLTKRRNKYVWIVNDFRSLSSQDGISGTLKLRVSARLTARMEIITRSPITNGHSFGTKKKHTHRRRYFNPFILSCKIQTILWQFVRTSFFSQTKIDIFFTD